MRGRVDHLDGIRALAILAVLGAHWVATYLPVGKGGYLGVDVFFVLSGFVITSVMWRSRSNEPVGRQYVTFLRKRVRRLYPALLALVVVSPIAVALAPGAAVTATDAAERGLLAAVQGTWVLEAMGETTDPFRQTWSLAIEWYFYLLWPLALYTARRRGVPARTFARWSALTAVVLYAAALPMSGLLFYGTPPARFAEILVGAVIALAVAEPAAPDRPGRIPTGRGPQALALLALAAVTAYVVLAPWHYTADPVRWLGVPLAVAATGWLVLHGVAETGGPALRLLSWGPLALLGRASYSLYLWHWLPVYLLDKDSIGLPVPVLALLGVGLAAGLTTASYLLLERPFMGSHAAALRPGRESPAPTERV